MSGDTREKQQPSKSTAATLLLRVQRHLGVGAASGGAAIIGTAVALSQQATESATETAGTPFSYGPVTAGITGGSTGPGGTPGVYISSIDPYVGQLSASYNIYDGTNTPANLCATITDQTVGQSQTVMCHGQIVKVTTDSIMPDYVPSLRAATFHVSGFYGKVPETIVTHAFSLMAHWQELAVGAALIAAGGYLLFDYSRNGLARRVIHGLNSGESPEIAIGKTPERRLKLISRRTEEQQEDIIDALRSQAQTQPSNRAEAISTLRQFAKNGSEEIRLNATNSLGFLAESDGNEAAKLATDALRRLVFGSEEEARRTAFYNAASIAKSGTPMAQEAKQIILDMLDSKDQNISELARRELIRMLEAEPKSSLLLYLLENSFRSAMNAGSKTYDQAMQSIDVPMRTLESLLTSGNSRVREAAEDFTSDLLNKGDAQFRKVVRNRLVKLLADPNIGSKKEISEILENN